MPRQLDVKAGPVPVAQRAGTVTPTSQTRPLAAEMLKLQRTAGNRAVQRLLDRKAPAVPAASRSGGSDGVEVSRAEARSIVDRYIEVLGPLGATVKPFPSDFPAPAERVTSTPALQRSSVARTPALDPSAGDHYKFEGGVVGAAQLCWDLCTGEVSVTGWLWAGGGVVTPGLFGGESWWGAYVFAEGDLFGPWQVDWLPRVSCGTCAPSSQPSDDHDVHWGAGIAGFPVVIKPGQRTVFGKGGIEAGVLLTPHPTRGDADLEVIVLLDLTRVIPPPVGPAIVSAVELAKVMGKKLKIDLDCGVGLAVSGSVHLCKSVPGGGILGITSDSASLCGGGYIGCGIGLPRSKAGLPGMKSPPGTAPAPAPAPGPVPVKPPARPPVRQHRRHGRHGRGHGRRPRRRRGRG